MNLRKSKIPNEMYNQRQENNKIIHKWAHSITYGGRRPLPQTTRNRKGHQVCQKRQLAPCHWVSATRWENINSQTIIPRLQTI